MLSVGSDEQAIDGDVEGVLAAFACVIVLAALSEVVWRDGVRASSIMGCERGEEG